MPTNRDKAGRFIKGKSGNPNGRPKVPEQVKEMLKAASESAARFLIDTVNNSDVAINIRIDCAKELLNRVYGKSSQPIDADINGELGVTVVLADEIEQYAK